MKINIKDIRKEYIKKEILIHIIKEMAILEIS